MYELAKFNPIMTNIKFKTNALISDHFGSEIMAIKSIYIKGNTTISENEQFFII